MKKTVLILGLIFSIKLFAQTTVVDWSTIQTGCTGTVNTSNTPNAIVTINGSGFTTASNPGVSNTGACTSNRSPYYISGKTNNWGMNGLGLGVDWANTTSTVNVTVVFTTPVCTDLFFDIHDIDGNTGSPFEDKVTILGYDGNGTLITVNTTNYVWSNCPAASICGNVQLYTAGTANSRIGRCTNGNSNANSYGNSSNKITFTLKAPTTGAGAGRIKRVEIIYGSSSTSNSNGYMSNTANPGFQNIVIGNIFAKIPPVLNIAIPVCNTNSTSVNLSATATSTTSPTYAWTNSGGTINSGSSGLTPNVKGPGTFTLTAYNSVATCSTNASITLTNVDCNLLSADLTDFNAVKEKESITLNWQTNSEVNNDYFVIEKSADGLNFESIDVVKGAGTTNRKINYQSIDKNLSSGIIYYRLKQVDFDGKSSYSKTVSIEGVDKEYNVGNPLPNPTSAELSIDFNVKTNSDFIVEIIDVTGKKVKTFTELIETGFSSKNFNIVNLESGLYFLYIKSTDGKYFSNHKIIKH